MPKQFIRLVRMVQPGKWRAAAVLGVDNGEHTLEKIGPRMCDTERAANDWLDAEAKKRKVLVPRLEMRSRLRRRTAEG
jgi:hypothetical protein